MKNIIKFCFIVVITQINLIAEDIQQVKNREHSIKKAVQRVLEYEPKETSTVNKFRQMFTDAKVTGQVELMYSGFNVEDALDPYATAVGGHLLFELAEYNGFNAGVEFSTAQDINIITGEDDKQDPELSSTDGSYTEATQAFINYAYDGLSVRIGRQIIDTPLADSDDRRIIYNTFEAGVITYERDNLSFMLGYLDRWQGIDVGPDADNPWQSTGDDGVYFGGLLYSVNLFDASIWYYDMSGDKSGLTTIGNVANKSIYTDISFHISLAKEYKLHANAQYLNQSEKDNSGIGASVYGAMAEIIIQNDLAFSVAYNKSEKQSLKGVFSGYGGGTLYTNMDKTLLTDISVDRDAQAIVAGITYTMGDFGFLYAYGDFDGDADFKAQKERIIEQDIGIEYKYKQELKVGIIYNISKDKENTASAAYFPNGKIGGNYENFRVVLAYNF